MPAVRLAQAGEGASLTALCMRSKAHWGYDAAFMRKSAAALLVSEASIAAGRVLVAIDDAGRTIGTVSVAEDGETAELALMFVDPPAIGGGTGRMLFEAAVGPWRADWVRAHDDPRRPQRRAVLRAHGRALPARRAVRRHSRPHPAVL